MKKQWIICIYIYSILSWQCSKNKDSVDLKNGLKLYFPFNGNVKDSTGYAGIVVYNLDAVKWVANRKGNDNNAMFLDGGTISISMPSWSFDKISLSLWIKRATINYDDFFLAASSAAFGLFETDDHVKFAVSTPATNLAGATVSMEWTHIAGTWDGNEIAFYVNGDLISTIPHPSGNPDPVSLIKIGDDTNENWKGSLDELRIYNRVLSHGEIQHLANE